MYLQRRHKGRDTVFANTVENERKTYVNMPTTKAVAYIIIAIR